MTKVIFFGSGGAVGSYLKNLFEGKAGFEVLGVSRADGLDLLDESKMGIFANEKILSFAKGAYVVNCAAYNGDGTIRNQKIIEQVNVDGTLRLIHQCNEVGVARFYQLSSYKALGEDSSSAGFNLGSLDKPSSVYGSSKSRLDQQALKLDLGIDISVLRLPMIYGGRTGGSILKLKKLVGFPLPVSRLSKKRDYLSLDNLGTYLQYLFAESTVSKLLYLQDKGALSTDRLLGILADVENKKNRKFPLPEFLLDFFMRLPIVGNLAKKLNGFSYINEAERLHLSEVTTTECSLSKWLIEVRDNKI